MFFHGNQRMVLHISPKWTPNPQKTSESGWVVFRNTKQQRCARQSSQMSRSAISTFHAFDISHFRFSKTATLKWTKMREIMSMNFSDFFFSNFKVSSNRKTERESPAKWPIFLSHFQLWIWPNPGGWRRLVYLRSSSRHIWFWVHLASNAILFDNETPQYARWKLP